MGNIDFQNGFLCGLATRGLTRSGEFYRPGTWNDAGVYTHFYIDFRRALEPFTFEMFNSSVFVIDARTSGIIAPSGAEQVSPGVCRVSCDIANRPYGVLLLSKVPMRLKFVTGGKVPTFAAHMFVDGLQWDFETMFFYEYATCTKESAGVAWMSAAETSGLAFWTAHSAGEDASLLDAAYQYAGGTAAETASVTLV